LFEKISNCFSEKKKRGSYKTILKKVQNIFMSEKERSRGVKKRKTSVFLFLASERKKFK